MSGDASKAEQIAQCIESDLRVRQITRMGTLEDLSRTYDASRVIVARAVRLLCDKGVLDARPGRGIRVLDAHGRTSTPASAKSHQAREVEKHLRELVRTSPAYYLPSISRLRSKHHASTAEVRAVFALLKKEGLVRPGNGRRFMIVRDSASGDEWMEPPALSSEENLYRRFRARIESGAYRTGLPLPKIAYLAQSEKAAPRIVVRVCRRLVRDGVVFRQGRSLVPGSPQSADEMSTQHHNKCMLIVQPVEATWDAFAVTSWTQPFAQAVMREISLYGVEPRTVLYRDEDDVPQVPVGVPSGREEIGRLVDQLGDRLIGMLVVNLGWKAGQPMHTQKTLSTMQWLCGFGKPVVSFDHFGEWHEDFVGPELRAMIERRLAHPPVRRGFIRCHFDYLDNTRLAVSLLRRYGHRVVGFPTLGSELDWMGFRLRDLRYSAESAGVPVRVLDATDCPPLFDTGPQTRLDEVVSVLAGIDRAFARAIIPLIGAMGDQSACMGAIDPDHRELLILTAHLGAFLQTPDLTAIIAPNDELARMFYRWFLVVGIKVPEDLSLLSFDDRVDSAYPYTISSINFGFDNLGFTAFHAILGDIPVKTDKWLSVAAKCRINHYATLGQAR